MNEPQLMKRRPAETKTASLGGVTILAVSVLEAMHIRVTGAWLKVITGAVAFAPACFTWLEGKGGIRGVARSIFGRRDEPRPEPTG